MAASQRTVIACKLLNYTKRARASERRDPGAERAAAPPVHLGAQLQSR